MSITTSKCSPPAPAVRPGRPRGNCDCTDVICNRWTPRQTYEPQHDIFRLSVTSLVSITTSKCSPAAPAVGPGQEETVIVLMSYVTYGHRYRLTNLNIIYLDCQDNCNNHNKCWKKGVEHTKVVCDTLSNAR